jgi:hypothetical protein
MVEIQDLGPSITSTGGGGGGGSSFEVQVHQVVQVVVLVQVAQVVMDHLPAVQEHQVKEIMAVYPNSYAGPNYGASGGGGAGGAGTNRKFYYWRCWWCRYLHHQLQVLQ